MPLSRTKLNIRLPDDLDDSFRAYCHQQKLSMNDGMIAAVRLLMGQRQIEIARSPNHAMEAAAKATLEKILTLRKESPAVARALDDVLEHLFQKK